MDFLFRPALSFFEDVFPRYCVLCGTPMRTWLPGIRSGGSGSSEPAGGAALPVPLTREGIIPRNFPICPPCLHRLRPLGEPRCAQCGKTLISEQGLCMRCRGRSHSVDSVIPIFRYSGAAAALVGAYKTGKRKSLAPWFAAILAGELKSRWPDAIVVPVPPRPEKAEGRDWDQVEAIISRLSRSGVPVSRCLCRTASAQQKRLGRQDRELNSRLAYHVKTRHPVPLSAVIVDDVFTTGATVETCAALLKDSGTISVHALVLAAD